MSTPNEAGYTVEAEVEAEAQHVVPPKTPSPPPALAAADAAEPAAPPAAPAPSPAALQLQALFPDTPLDIIEEVLRHEGSLEASTTILLEMGDTSFKPPPPISQIDADAEMARMLEEEDRAANYRTANIQADSSPRGPLAYQPYRPKSRPNSTGSGGGPGGASQQQQPQTTSSAAKDELDQLAEGFSKLAEQGKKTLGSFFTKVKTQINALDSPGTSASGSQAPPPPEKGWTPPTALPRPQPQAQRQPTAVPELLPRASPVPSPATESPPALASATSTTPPPASVSATDKDVSEPAAPLDPKKDFSKLGLLPRREVSLLDSSKGKGSAHDDSDDDDLEYVRSPFDDD